MLGDFLFVKGAFALDPLDRADLQIAALYGTGSGEIPFHITPEDAKTDGNGLVQTVTNRGGAREQLDVIATSGLNQNGASTTAIDEEFFLNAGTHGGLLIQEPLEAVGIRLYLILRFDQSPNLSNLAGYSGPDISANGGRVSFLWARTNPRLQIDRWNGTANASETAIRGTPLEIGSWYLMEIENTIENGLRVWINGELYLGDGELNYSSLFLQRILWGYLAQPFIGAAKDILILNANGGSLDFEERAAAIRRALAIKRGIALAG